MSRLLIFEPSLERIAPKVADILDQVEVVRLTREGELKIGGHVVSTDDAQPNAAWASQDVFSSPHGRTLMIATLKAGDLKWVQSAAAGFDNPIFRQIVDKGASLTTSHGQAVGMADYVLWGVLDHFQRGPERRAAQGDGVWRRSSVLREVVGSTWLIVGFGAIGQGVAQRARGFGAKIIGARRDQTPHDLADELISPDKVLERLPEADVVVLSLPLTDQTRDMVDAPFLAAMKPRSVLVNVGRGGLVDEPALLAALDAGKPEHALLDVFVTEPLPEGSPFYSHPRVTLTPHSSGIGETSAARNDEIFAENLRRFVRGEPLKNVAKREDILAG